MRLSPVLSLAQPKPHYIQNNVNLPLSPALSLSLPQVHLLRSYAQVQVLPFAILTLCRIYYIFHLRLSRFPYRSLPLLQPLLEHARNSPKVRLLMNLTFRRRPLLLRLLPSNSSILKLLLL